MNSYLIVGGNQEERKNQAQKLAADVHPVDQITLTPEPSIGIDQVRELKKSLFLKPIKSRQKIAFIFEAEKMTLPAQNALLKTLEEPPGESLLILTATKLDILLPTISSRCRVINLKEKSEVQPTKEEFLKQEPLLDQIFRGGVGERLVLSDQIAKDREESLNWLNTQATLWRYILLSKTGCTNLLPKDFDTNFLQKINDWGQKLSSSKITQTLKKVKEAQKLLEQNVHLRLTLDNLLLEYPKV